MNWDLHRITIIGIIILLIPPIFFEAGARTVPRTFMAIGLFATLTIALNIVFGHTDQLVLFSGAMAATGAYVSIMLADFLAISPWFTMLVGATLAGLIGAGVAWVAARRGAGIIAIAILTLALNFAFFELINHFRSHTGGETGYRVTDMTITPIEELPWFTHEIVLFYVIGILLIAVMLVYRYIMNSKYGLAFEMIRQDQGAAESVGVNIIRYKVLAAFIAMFVMGLAGPLMGARGGWLTPTVFDFGHVDVLILIMLVIGGLRTLWGPVIGAAIIIVLHEELREFAAYRTMIFGIILVFLFLYFRQGIVPYATQQVKRRNLVERSKEFIPGTRS